MINIMNFEFQVCPLVIRYGDVTVVGNVHSDYRNKCINSDKFLLLLSELVSNLKNGCSTRSLKKKLSVNIYELNWVINYLTTKGYIIKLRSLFHSKYKASLKLLEVFEKKDYAYIFIHTEYMNYLRTIKRLGH